MEGWHIFFRRAPRLGERAEITRKLLRFSRRGLQKRFMFPETLTAVLEGVNVIIIM
jgi:hypothetical protein